MPANVSPASEGRSDRFVKMRVSGSKMSSNNTNSPSFMTYSDGIMARERKPFLLFIKGEEVVSFEGGTIPNIAVVRGTSYTKNGKWSHTTYRLELAPGVRAISGHNGWETNKFPEGLKKATGFSKAIDTWTDVANAMGVSVTSAMAFLRDWRPNAATALDQVDQQLSALDEVAVSGDVIIDSETVVVSFGSPTNRAIAEGFWKCPKSITGHGGKLELVDETKGWTKDNIQVTGMSGAVLSATHAAGHHGGYVTVNVAVIPGSEVAKTEEKPTKTPFALAPVVSPHVYGDLIPTQPVVGTATLGDLMAKFGKR